MSKPEEMTLLDMCEAVENDDRGYVLAECLYMRADAGGCRLPLDAWMADADVWDLAVAQSFLGNWAVAGLPPQDPDDDDGSYANSDEEYIRRRVESEQAAADFANALAAAYNEGLPEDERLAPVEAESHVFGQAEAVLEIDNFRAVLPQGAGRGRGRATREGEVTGGGPTVSHLMTDGRPCGRPDGHKGRHYSIETARRERDRKAAWQKANTTCTVGGCDKPLWSGTHRCLVHAWDHDFEMGHRRRVGTWEVLTGGAA